MVIKCLFVASPVDTVTNDTNGLDAACVTCRENVIMVTSVTIVLTAG